MYPQMLTFYFAFDSVFSIIYVFLAFKVQTLTKSLKTTNICKLRVFCVKNVTIDS